MLPRITNVCHGRDYVLELTFDDGLCAELDIQQRIVSRGGVFAPLEDIHFFRQVRTDPDFGTLVWPNDVDFCPEALHDGTAATTSSTAPTGACSSRPQARRTAYGVAPFRPEVVCRWRGKAVGLKYLSRGTQMRWIGGIRLSRRRNAILAAGLLLAAVVAGCGRREAAKAPPFPARPAARAMGSGVEFYDIQIEGSGPGRPMNLNLYLPAGRHEPHSLPCVFIAPAGSGDHGSLIDESDRAEHLPYVRAGFAVAAYELSGALDNPKKRQHT